MWTIFAFDQAWPEFLHRWADISSIATFLLALGGSLWFFPTYWFGQRELQKKQRKLEDYLKAAGETRSLLRIVGEVGLTQEEIIQASFRSQHIRSEAVHDKETTLTVGILFQYVKAELRKP